MNRIFDFTTENDIIQVNYKYNTGHRLGESFLSPDKKYSYINIPKNASSMFKQLFNTWSFVNFQNIKQQPSREYIAILRDPTDRWISATAEYLVGKYSTLGPKNNTLTDLEIIQVLESNFFQNLLFDFVIFDGHSLPQCWFLQQLNLQNIKFFYFDKTVNERVSVYTGTTYNNHWINQSLTFSKKSIIITYLKNLIDSDASLRNIIDKHYYADHKLFDLVKF
jgi:hypothetical protein